jgi:hypothetical protein
VGRARNERGHPVRRRRCVTGGAACTAEKARDREPLRVESAAAAHPGSTDNIRTRPARCYQRIGDGGGNSGRFWGMPENEARTSRLTTSRRWAQHLRLQIVTVGELLDGRRLDIPPVRQTSVTYKRAQKAAEQQRIFGEDELLGAGLCAGGCCVIVRLIKSPFQNSTLVDSVVSSVN